MLKHLYIRNFTLIGELDMEFRSGFSVITGETGAGKSIIIGAIGLLLGQRADMKTIKQGADKCVVEAHFDLTSYDGMSEFCEANDIEPDLADTIIRRELTSAGKSRAFVNDTPVALTVLKDLGDRIIDIHSQHQNLLLGKHDFQLSVVDVIAGDRQELSDYQALFDSYRNANRQLDELRSQIASVREQADFMRFQFDELTAAHLVDGEQEELETRSDTMTHAEEIKQALYQADGALTADGTGIVGQARSAVQALRGIERVLPAAASLVERLDSVYIEVKDVAAEVGSLMEDVDFDPSELDSVNARLDRIYSLQQKYRVQTVAELLQISAELGEKLAAVDGGDELLAEREQEVKKLYDACMEKARLLTAKRREAASRIEGEMRQRLELLAMPRVRFEVAVEGNELTRSGYDRVSFLFSANASSPLQPVSQVASGGEIARVMLSLKAMISGAASSKGEADEGQKGGTPTIIFDEIDTGVSGKIAEQMALIMAEMGLGGQQVISITHLPQIAALGTTHYRVYKDETAQGTATHLVMLSPEERVSEIAQMLSGSDVTAAAIENARQLLRLGS